MIASFYYKKDKDDQVAFNQNISILTGLLNNLFYVIALAYFLGLGWFRFTDAVLSHHGDEESFVV